MESPDNTDKWLDFMEMMEKMMVEQFGEIIVDHANYPRNTQRLTDPHTHASVTGECGDTIEIWLKVMEGRIDEIAFKATGCDMTRAVGSMLTEMAKGKTLPEALQIKPPQLLEALGGRLPEDHVHCAFLATNALHEAVEKLK